MPKRTPSPGRRKAAPGARVRQLETSLGKARDAARADRLEARRSRRVADDAVAESDLHQEGHRDQLRSLASELALAEERERRRIAVEIHDRISQSLAMAKMRLDGLCHRLASSDARGELDEVVTLVETVLAHTRSLTFELSPPVLYELGLGPALEWLAERAGASHGLEVRVETPRHAFPPPPQDVSVFMYQAVRELLMNIGKHAGARRAWVRMWRRERELRVCVEDDGRGFGLFSIRTRLDHLGGTMSIETRQGGGGRVTMAMPLERANAASPRGGEEESGAQSGRTSNPVSPRDGRKTRHESIDRRRPSHGTGGIA